MGLGILPLQITDSFHNFKSQNFKLSVSNPKSKYVVYLSVLSQISNCQGLGRKNKHEVLKTDRILLIVVIIAIILIVVMIAILLIVVIIAILSIVVIIAIVLILARRRPAQPSPAQPSPAQPSPWDATNLLVTNSIMISIRIISVTMAVISATTTVTIVRIMNLVRAGGGSQGRARSFIVGIISSIMYIYIYICIYIYIHAYMYSYLFIYLFI